MGELVDAELHTVQRRLWLNPGVGGIALIGVSSSVVQAGVLRGAAWAARGLRVPACNALLADVVPAQAYGRAYGFERTMDNLGAIVGPPARSRFRVAVQRAHRDSALGDSGPAGGGGNRLRDPPGEAAEGHRAQKLRFQVRPVLRGQMGRVLAGFAAFEVGNVAATLLILRATDVLIPGRGVEVATQIAIALYVVYNVAATLTSFPAGGLSDKLGRRGPLLVTAVGVAAFLAAYLVFAVSGPVISVLLVAFALAGWGSAARRPPSTPPSPRSPHLSCAARRLACSQKN